VPEQDERLSSGTEDKRRSSGVGVFSGAGVGFCRFDYRRDLQRLSVVMVPSEPGRSSVGRVDRWW